MEGDKIESEGETTDEDIGIGVGRRIGEGISEGESFTERNAKRDAHRTGHEIVMILPPTLKEREKHFPAINTVLKVTPSYYDAPDSTNVTTVFTYIEQVSGRTI
jgi:hypothetical protein